MTPAGAPATVLIADDDEGIRSLIRVTLDTGRFRIAEAEDGEAALSEARRLRPALIFLDWRMPGRSGIEVCRALRADPTSARTRIVMVTARSSPADREAVLRAGADDFIAKPFSPVALLEKVAEVLGPEALSA